MSLSGEICCKSQVNHGVRVDIKTKRQGGWKGSVIEHVDTLWGSWGVLYAVLNLGVWIINYTGNSFYNRISQTHQSLKWIWSNISTKSKVYLAPTNVFPPANQTPSILVTLPLKVTFSLPFLTLPQSYKMSVRNYHQLFLWNIGPICLFPEAGPNALGQPNGSCNFLTFCHICCMYHSFENLIIFCLSLIQA